MCIKIMAVSPGCDVSMSAFTRYAASWMVRRLCIEMRYAILADGEAALSLSSSTMKLGLLAGQLHFDHIMMSSGSSLGSATTPSRAAGRKNNRRSWNSKAKAKREVIMVVTMSLYVFDPSRQRRLLAEARPAAWVLELEEGVERFRFRGWMGLYHGTRERGCCRYVRGVGVVIDSVRTKKLKIGPFNETENDRKPQQSFIPPLHQ